MFGLALGKNVEAEVEVLLLCFLLEDLSVDYGILFSATTHFGGVN